MSISENQKLGFWSTVLLGLNAMIGSGIFLLPGKIMHLAGNWTFFVYVFVALLSLAIGWCFAQCATLFSRNGGSYIYAREAFGEFIGFEIGIMRSVAGVIAWASLTVGFVTALSSIWPAALLEPIRSILILSLVAGLAYLNMCGVKTFKGLNNLITIAKLLPLALVIILGICFIKYNHFTLSTGESITDVSFGPAALILLYAFGGFDSLVTAAGEVKNPTKNVPRAVMLVLILCGTLYCFIQFIAVGILGPQLLALSETPIADMAQSLFGQIGKWFIVGAMLISIGGVNIACSFFVPLSVSALAEDGMIPQIIAAKNQFDAPYRAILITAILTCIVALTGNFAQLVAISAISRFAQYISTCAAAFIFYMRKKLEPGKIHTNWKLLIPVFAISGLAWLLFQATWQQTYIGLGPLILALPFYFLQRRRTVVIEN